MIRIVALVENTTVSPTYRSKHGLSLYIETPKHKILFDVGPDALFMENAEKKKIDLAEIDTVVISHGHMDHGGALREFLNLNTKAKVYIRREAFEPHYIKVLKVPVKVGLEKELLHRNQIILTDEKTVIDDELLLFSNVKSDMHSIKSNRVLYAKKQGKLILDDFGHEQSLIISTEEGHTLISGCSHAGIVSIQNHAEQLVSEHMTTVIGGFHLYNPPTKKYEREEIIDCIAASLKEKNSVYYTCHCTGKKAYERMKRTLNGKLHYLSTGEELVLRK